VADRDAERQCCREVEAVDVAQVFGARVGTWQELETRPEIWVRRTGFILVARRRLEAVEPQRHVLVNLLELALCREIDAVARACDQVIETHRLAARFRRDL